MLQLDVMTDAEEGAPANENKIATHTGLLALVWPEIPAVLD